MSQAYQKLFQELHDSVSYLQAQPDPPPPQLPKELERVTQKWEYITPLRAKRALATMTGNRRVSPRVVRGYTVELTANRWAANGETIKFDWHGNLIDGQHRLLACIFSGKGFWALVVRGLDPAAFATVDLNKVRSFGDLGDILGYQYSRQLGAALNVLYAVLQETKDGTPRRRINSQSKPLLLEYLQSHSSILESIELTRSMRGKLPHGVAAACHYLFSLVDIQRAYDFFDALSRGANLPDDSPVLVLIQRLWGGNRLNAAERLALTVKAWNAFYTGKTIRVIRWGPQEDFPEIEGLPQAFIQADRDRMTDPEYFNISATRLVHAPFSPENPNEKGKEQKRW